MTKKELKCELSSKERINEFLEEVIQHQKDVIRSLNEQKEEILKAQNKGCTMGSHCKGCVYAERIYDYMAKSYITYCGYSAGRCKNFVKRG